MNEIRSTTAGSYIMIICNLMYLYMPTKISHAAYVSRTHLNISVKHQVASQNLRPFTV